MYINDHVLVLISSGVVLEVIEREKLFYRTLRDLVERTYRHTFNLQYTNQSTDSKNEVIHKLQEAFWEQLSMRSMRLAIKKITITKRII
jgi:hypothetical protein